MEFFKNCDFLIKKTILEEFNSEINKNTKIDKKTLFSRKIKKFKFCYTHIYIYISIFYKNYNILIKISMNIVTEPPKNLSDSQRVEELARIYCKGQRKSIKKSRFFPKKNKSAYIFFTQEVYIFILFRKIQNTSFFTLFLV